jgi:hypothetical protein
MAESKIEKWINWAERLIALIRPRFHNKITKTVVFFGLALIAESQVNIIEAFSIAGYESIFGPSEYLRNLFDSKSYPLIGVLLVIFGLIYNAIITVGLELIQKYKDAIPQQPQFEFEMLNGDLEVISRDYKLRGKICHHSISKIPDNSEYSEFTRRKMDSEAKMGIAYNTILRSLDPSRPRVNKDFYRERAEFLRVWGGAEIIRLAITNSGKILARNVRVELKIDKVKGLSASNNNDIYPELPSQETENSSLYLHGVNHPVPSYDIKNRNSKSEYFFEWIVGHLQAGEHSNSRTCIFLRTEVDILLKCKIYCDELSEPIFSEYIILPPSGSFEFDLGLITCNYNNFFEKVDDKIMDGYLSRLHQNIIEDHDNRQYELLPK